MHNFSVKLLHPLLLSGIAGLVMSLDLLASEADPDRATSTALYLEKCAGCHAVDRSGRSGRELYMQLMRDRDEISIKRSIHFGTSTGMPNWGTSDLLSAEQIDELTEFLRHSDSDPTDVVFDFSQVLDSWQLGITAADHLKKSESVTDAEKAQLAAMAADTPNVTTLPVAREIDLDGDPVRLIHPQFDANGTEVWMTAWNLQDRRSAVVVFDDLSKSIKTVIEDPRLVTPIRTFALAGLSTIGQR